MIRRLARRIRRHLNGPVLDEARYQAEPAASQLALMNTWRQLLRVGAPPLSFPNVGFKAFSQFEEDGILLFIFTMIGMTDRRCVEVCAGDGRECNTANLILNHQFTGLLCDGDEQNVAAARAFFDERPQTRYWPPQITQAWITAENVNDLIREHGFEGPIDLLSIDIDGVDYWLWKAIDCIQPRVVVTEINHLWGASEAVTVPYDPNFRAGVSEYGTDYAGASLPAFVKLAAEKGYRLVGTNAIATNAFFVHHDVRHPWLEAVDAATCFDHPRAQFGIKHRLPKVKDRPWQRV